MGRGKIFIESDGVRSMDCFIVNGFLYPAVVGNNLYEVLVSLNPSDFETKGTNAREDVLKTYMVEQNLSVLRSIL